VSRAQGRRGGRYGRRGAFMVVPGPGGGGGSSGISRVAAARSEACGSPGPPPHGIA
jgi:hypothetical protein